MKWRLGTNLTLIVSVIIALGFRTLKFVPPLAYFIVYFIKHYTKCVYILLNISDSSHNIVILFSFTPLNWVFLDSFQNRATFVDGQSLLRFSCEYCLPVDMYYVLDLHIYLFWLLINNGQMQDLWFHSFKMLWWLLRPCRTFGIFTGLINFDASKRPFKLTLWLWLNGSDEFGLFMN